MAWFKVDDGFYHHPKVIGLSMATRGLWLTAGTYCASYLTDGYISKAQIKSIGGTPVQVKALVSAGLWLAIDSEYYLFHDWIHYQITREADAIKRESNRNSQRKGRAEQAKQRTVNADTPTVSGGPVPALPVPALPEEIKDIKKPAAPKQKPLHLLPEGWTPSADNDQKMRAKYPHVDHAALLASFHDYWMSAAKNTKRDWDAAWRMWLSNDAKFNPVGTGRQSGFSGVPSKASIWESVANEIASTPQPDMFPVIDAYTLEEIEQ